MAIDLIFAIFAGLGFYLGFNRGIIKTVFTVLSYIFGFTAAVKFAPSMTKFLESLLSYENPLMFIAGFLLSFVVTMLGIRWIASLLENALEAANINLINRVLGGGLLAGIMILAYSMLLQFYDASGGINNYDKQQSITYQYLEQYPAQVQKGFQLLKPTFQEFWAYSRDFLNGLQEIGSETLDQTESSREIRDID